MPNFEPARFEVQPEIMNKLIEGIRNAVSGAGDTYVSEFKCNGADEFSFTVKERLQLQAYRIAGL
jgi:hypothetical protein